MITGKAVDFGGRGPPAIAVSDDDFEEYEEFLAWKKKHGLRATIRKMARRQGVDEPDDRDLRDRVKERETARDVSRLNKAIAKQEETARDIAKLKGSLEDTMDSARKDKVIEERLDGGRIVKKAKRGKRKQWDASEEDQDSAVDAAASADDTDAAEEDGPRRSSKVKAQEKEVEEEKEEAPKALDKKEKDRQVNKIKKLKK